MPKNIAKRRPAETTSVILGAVIALLMMVGLDQETAASIAPALVGVVPAVVTALVERLR